MRESPTARWKVNAGAASRDVRPDALQRGDGEAEAGDRDGERVEVDAVDRVERRLHAGLELPGRGVPVPPVEQPVEGAEQEVAGPAGRVDQLEAFERPNSVTAGSRVRSRMNSSTNSGVCSSA